VVHIHCTARKSTGGHLTIGHLAHCGTPRHQEELVEPQQEESAELQEKLAEMMQSVEDAIHSQGDSSDPSHYTLRSDPVDSHSEPEPIRAATEFRSYDEESPTVPTQLRGLLFQLGITRALEYRVKSVPRPRHMELTYTVEVFDGQDAVNKQACPTLVCLLLRQW
jgi:hypothetical protein